MKLVGDIQQMDAWNRAKGAEARQHARDPVENARTQARTEKVSREDARLHRIDAFLVETSFIELEITPEVSSWSRYKFARTKPLHSGPDSGHLPLGGTEGGVELKIESL